MPNTRLILHVKGTQAETAELPKEVVRAAISQGQLTHSQLIWSPVDNAWKQARELPDLLPGERLILHVKGTEAETTELPKQAVRAAISQGQLTHSQLIWSSADKAWKQVRELPDLLPSQKLAPSPSREAAVPVPAAAGPPQVQVQVRMTAAAAAIPPQARVAVPAASPPKVRVATPAASPPKVRVATPAASPPKVRVGAPAAGTPTVRAAGPVSDHPTGHFVVKEHEHAHPLKWLCIGLGIAILLALGGNYLLVDQPLVSNLGQTPYSNVGVYAHFGAFLQPTVMVIHIPASASITPDNLTDFLVTLARSTPQNPFTRDPFTRVALTSGWTAQYSFSGFSWKRLGDMAQEGKDQQKEALLARLGDAGGQPLMPDSSLNEAAQQAKRDQIWDAFVAHFAAKP